MRQEIITSLRTSQSGGINSGFSESGDAEFYRHAVDLISTRDVLEASIRKLDGQIRSACTEFGERNSMWGVNPTILRRELKLRGFSV